MYVDLAVCFSATLGSVRWTGAVVCCLLGLAWTQSAQASCGDYLHGNVPAELSGHEGYRSAGSGRSSTPQIPCNGPGCRQAPTVPLEGRPVVPIEIERQDCCGLVDSPDLYEDLRSTVCGTAAWFWESPAGDRLDRPPQVV